MHRIALIMILALSYACTTNSQPSNNRKAEKAKLANDTSKVITKSEEEWKAILTRQQFDVLRNKATDRPFTGEYYLHHEKGVYSCAACGNELFTSDMKFDSACGWPSFDREMAGDKIKQIEDTTHGMVRTEIVCARCGSHLGHIFNDGPTLTGMRYCVNSTSIDFTKDSKTKEKNKK